MKQTKHLAVAWLFLLFFGVLLCPLTAHATTLTPTLDAGIDPSTLTLEVTAQDVSYTEANSDAGYTLALQRTGDNSFLYGLCRQNLNWAGQQGISITLNHQGDGYLYFALQLVDENWQSITPPDGTAVFLKQQDNTYYTKAEIAQGSLAIPPQFCGQIYLALDAQNETLRNLQGIGVTFTPQHSVNCTISAFSFWDDAFATLYDTYCETQLSLQDDLLMIPWVGQNITTTSITGLRHTPQLTYTLTGAPNGMYITNQGCITAEESINDSANTTADAAHVVVQAMVDEQILLEKTLTLCTVWQVKPEATALKDFLILEPITPTPPLYLQLYAFGLQHLALLRLVGLGALVAIVTAYWVWRQEAKKALPQTPQQGHQL